MDDWSESDLRINPRAYAWGARAFEAVEERLGLRVRLHDDDGLMEKGHVFLFNHFARFETIIPPYLIYRRTGAYTRSIADHRLFAISERFSGLLAGLGAVPNGMPGLLPFLAAEILRGRKVSVFPEGGMVKDRAVIDPATGAYSVFSRTAEERRPHHRGAAVLALVLDIFKQRIRAVAARGEAERLERWRAALGLADTETLLRRAEEPTRVVPGTITFHPIRVGDTFLTRAIDLFAEDLPAQAMEELLIESNILLRSTDMDIRLGAPVAPGGRWRWWERRLIDKAFERVDSLEEMFASRSGAGWLERLAADRLSAEADAVRDAWMAAMYNGVTVNLSHLAATVIRRLAARGETSVGRVALGRLLYRALKALQVHPAAHLHPGLTEPDAYADLIEGRSAPLEEFLATAEAAGLVAREEGAVLFTGKLCADAAFDAVRLENPIAVYANEARPVAAVGRAVDVALDAAAMSRKGGVEPPLTAALFDDEARAHRLGLERYDQPRHAAINDQETATRSGAPYLLEPSGASSAAGGTGGVGVLVIHGFLASPAETRGLGGHLAAAGALVMGVRLAGHGTSPWDLRDRAFTDWLDSARRGYRLLAETCERIVVVGFSAGADIALTLAAERPRGLAGVCAVCAPIKFRDRDMVFVPLVHGLNRLMAWWPSLEAGVMPFRLNDSEHPEINYRHIPVRGVYELRRLVAHTLRLLPLVEVAALVIQADGDPVVDPASARQIMRRLGTARKDLVWVRADRHGIVYENIGGTHDLVVDFVRRVAPPPRT